MSWPDAEVDIDDRLVRRLLAAQHPDLADLPLAVIDAGFDNLIYRLGDDLALRLPRRVQAATLIEHEQRWLPLIAPRLTLPVPVPLRLGRAAFGFPWSWSVVPWMEGEPGDRVAATDMAETGRRLGRFLKSAHLPAPPDLPHNPWRSGPVASRADSFEDRIGRLRHHVDEGRLRSIWDQAVAAPVHGGPALWLHGDLHPANTLVRDGAVAAVIDFGDTCAGDPACDLGAAWMTVTQDGMAEFWSEYGAVDEATVLRSFGWAVLFGLMLLDIGLENRPTYADVGRSTLDRVSAQAD
ncbi:MAG TPA: aminoglycoside phosphotransferase family protein [Acidimicrobiales bacterium]|nr:aminoglycoside phosphotransferase family protein [Acidimicrobiales bacterium]